MKPVVTEALEQWGITDATCSFVAHRENEVWKIHDGNKKYALRLHRAGYRSDAELKSELDWMAALAEAGLAVPFPIAAKSASYMETIDGIQVDMLSWLDGNPMGETGKPLECSDRTGLFKSIGKQAAKLHLASDDWDAPTGFARCQWDIDGLLGEQPLWGRFWENPTLEPGDRDLLVRFRSSACERLETIRATADFGLIHADMVRENLILDQGKVQIIDFDDGGFGYRSFEIATILIKNLNEPDYPDLRDALLRGYRKERPLDTADLNLFLALRAATYAGWIMSKFEEAGAKDRNQRFIATCIPLVRSWLGK